MEKNLHNKYLAGCAVLIICLAFFNSGCERTEQGNPADKDVSMLFKESEYNLDLRDFSLAVASAARDNRSFRTVIREEALVMFDGDYDILVDHLSGKKVHAQIPGSKSGETLVSIKDLLNAYMPDKGEAGRKSGASTIDDLTEKYPYLQISVPVNAEELDDDYMPLVTFIPEEYDELTTTEVTAYTPEGTTLALDAVNPPDEPVIVISMNERVEIVEDPKAGGVPPIPFNLIGFPTESGIRLVWQMPDTTSTNNTTGYYIYRKTTHDVYYVKISTVAGINNKSYDDISVTPGQAYSYYVHAFYENTVSSASNILTIYAPQRPKPVLSFDAIQQTKNLVELRWQNDNSQYIRETLIYKCVYGIDADYKLIKSFTGDQHDYFDTDIHIGKKMVYKVVHVNDIGLSNAKYDFIEAPYRDISKKSPVYIKQIKFTDWKIEGWLAGKPEFYVTVTNVDSDHENAFKVQDQINCEFSSRSKTSQVFTSKKVFDWYPGFWFDMLTFTAVEYDRPSGELTFIIGVKYNTKDTLKIGFLQGSAGVDYKITFKNHGEVCGNSYLDYFADPESWLEFPNYGVEILISESDN